MTDSENKNDLQEAVVATIAFFDLFSYPLTAWEIWKYLYKYKIEYSELAKFLDQNDFQGKIIRYQSFYILPGREEIIDIKNKRYYFADQKFKRAVFISKIFKHIPGVKVIAVGNLIGAHNLRAKSDIDLFIITSPEALWTVRFLTVLITKILNLRPQPDNQKDKICLSFFVSLENLNLRKLTLQTPGGDVDDPYFIYWLAGLAPVYDSRNHFKRFTEANNWIKDYLPNLIYNSISPERNAGEKNLTIYKIILWLFRKYEEKLKKYQIKKFPKQIKDLMNKDTRVVVADGIIKLHVNDRREEYAEKFKVQMSKLDKII